ncbi:MAG: rhomboid family intramembrane serine protease, partial [Planctomycetales bacterium]
MTANLILLNVAVFGVDFFQQLFVYSDTQIAQGQVWWLSDWLSLKVGAQPWAPWEFLTYGFAHAPLNFQHIAFNMMALFFLGRDVEGHYGRREFLRLYLMMIVVSGLVWFISNQVQGNENFRAVGASGAVTGIVVLYAMLFPYRTLLLFFVIPVPAWLVGVIVVVMDLFGATHGSITGQPVAFEAHLAGAAFAYLYCSNRWFIGAWLPDFSWLERWWNSRKKRRTNLKLHDPSQGGSKQESKEANKQDGSKQGGNSQGGKDFDQEVDRVQDKISREGEAGQTDKERSLMDEASRRA